MRLEISYVEEIDNKTYVLNDGEMVLSKEGEFHRATLSVPITTQIDSEIEPSNLRELLDQKNSDKNEHIQNLNEILSKVIK